MDASLRYAPFSMTFGVTHSVFSCHAKRFLVIPSASEESSMDASLRYAPFSMTTQLNHILS